MQEFLSKCFYQPGQYKDRKDFGKLDERMNEVEKVRLAPLHKDIHYIKKIDSMGCWGWRGAWHSLDLGIIYEIDVAIDIFDFDCQTE